MKKVLKITAFVGSLLLIAGLLFFANGLLGNPISKYLAENAAQKRLEDVYSDTDYVLEEVQYSFKDCLYHASVSSPSSQDSSFSITFDWKGQFRSDNYELLVLGKANTSSRLDDQYRALTDEVFESSTFPYDCSMTYGVLEFVPRADLSMPGMPVYAKAREDLELDKVYDVGALGSEIGRIVIYVDSETITPAYAAEIMLEIRAVMDEAGIGFRAMDFSLQPPLPPEGPRPDMEIAVKDFPYEDIYEEGMVERILEANKSLRAYYAEQDAQKNKELQEAMP